MESVHWWLFGCFNAERAKSGKWEIQQAIYIHNFQVVPNHTLMDGFMIICHKTLLLRATGADLLLYHLNFWERSGLVAMQHLIIWHLIPDPDYIANHTEPIIRIWKCMVPSIWCYLLGVELSFRHYLLIFLQYVIFKQVLSMILW